MFIPLTRPTLRRKDYNSVLNCMVTDQIAPGPLNHDFITAASKVLGTAGGVALLSYSSCIRCALQLLGLVPGEGIVISSLAPKEYLQAIEAGGLIPMVTDVDPDRALLSADSAQKYVQAGAKAIVLYYTLGSLPVSDDLFQLGVPVIEDVSQAVGGQWAGKPCGSRGRAALLSLDPGGFVTAGCGGAVFSRDRRGAKQLKEIAGECCGEEFLPDMNAALGISQIRELPRFLQKRSEIGRLFREALRRSRHVPLLQEGESLDFGFPILVKDGRPEVRRYVEKKNIQTEHAFKYAIAALEGLSTAESEPLPQAEQLLWRCLLFPLYPSLSRKDVQLMCKVLSTLP